jgi:peptidoglycan/LPS O-acetylase OafA/YrhL
MNPAIPIPRDAPADSSTVKPDSRIPMLDGLRGIASLMVVAYHFGPHLVRLPESHFQFLHQLPTLWFKGVDLFFVLSGFLISGILVNARHSPRYFQTFYLRRAFRIFPLYYLVLLGYGAALLLHPDPQWRLFEKPLPFWTYALYLQNFAMTSADGFGAVWMAGSWSLAIEEQFYFTLPAVIRWVTDRGLFWFTTLGCAGALVLRAAIQHLHLLPPTANFVLLPTRLDNLAAGIFVMLALRYRKEWLMERRRVIGWTTLGLFGLWSLYSCVPNPYAIRLAFIERTITSTAFGLILLSLLLFPAGAISRFLSTGTMRNLGNMAYSTYLFHPIVLCLVFKIWRGTDPFLTDAADFGPIAIALAVTLILSWLSWSQFESRLLRIGHRYRY